MLDQNSRRKKHYLLILMMSLGLAFAFSIGNSWSRTLLSKKGHEEFDGAKRAIWLAIHTPFSNQKDYILNHLSEYRKELGHFVALGRMTDEQFQQIRSTDNNPYPADSRAGQMTLIADWAIAQVADNETRITAASFMTSEIPSADDLRTRIGAVKGLIAAGELGQAADIADRHTNRASELETYTRNI